MSLSDFGTNNNKIKPATKNKISAKIEERISKYPSIIPKVSVPMANPIFSAKSKAPESIKATSTQIKKGVRKHVLEKAKEKLDIDNEVEIDVEIETNYDTTVSDPTFFDKYQEKKNLLNGCLEDSVIP